MNYIIKIAIVAGVFLSAGFATKKPYDYSEYRNSDPKSILILPPKNSSLDVKAS